MNFLKRKPYFYLSVIAECLEPGNPRVWGLNPAQAKLHNYHTVCQQNGNRVTNNDKSRHISSIRQKGFLAKYEKCGTLSIYFE